jgi:hypothetical protein
MFSAVVVFSCDIGEGKRRFLSRPLHVGSLEASALRRNTQKIRLEE